MRIKKVIIQGFGSYNKAENPEVFGPGINAILGVNGSGKSNFFKAIQFVLSPKYMKIDEYKMKELFYKGRQDAVTTARVDIVFDNSDERFPVDSDEVVIRRAINGTNDSFYVNNKVYTKSEMESFLETAGFSRDNPYYMVEQGSVKQICELSDEGRLRLLKEVAGTRIYEERRQESQKVLEDTQLKVTQVNELISEMDASLQELETEKEALEEYEKYDRERRICVYFLASADIREKEEEINRCSINRKTLSDKLSELHQQYDDVRDGLKQCDAEIAAMTVESTSLENTIKQMEESRQVALKEVTTAELDLNELKRSTERREELAVRNQQRKEALEVELAAKQQVVQQITPQLENVQQMKAQIDKEYVTQKTFLETQEKQLRWNQSSENREELIQRELVPLQKDLEGKKELMESMKAQKEQSQNELNQLETTLQEKRTKKTQLARRQEEFHSQLQSVRNALESIVSERKRLWRENENRNTAIEKIQGANEKEQNDLHRVLPPDVHSALNALPTVQLENPASVYGPVVTLIKPKQDKFITAIENTAGVRLFHVAVQNDGVASQIIDHFQSTKAGRITLLPVEQMNAMVRLPTYPEDNRCFPLLHCIEYPQEVESVMVSIFGSTLLCENLQAATEVAEEYKMNCITLAGEKVSKRGAMRGGFFDSRTSRFRLFRSVRAKEDEITQKRAEQEENRKKLEQIHQQELDLLTQETKLESSNRLLTSSLVSLTNEERDIINRIQQLTESSTQLTSSLNALQAAYEEAVNQMQQLQNELEHPGELLSEEALQSAREQFATTEKQRQEIHRQYESFQLEQIQSTNRIHFIRKELLDLEESPSEVHISDAITYNATNSRLVVESKEQEVAMKKAEYDGIQTELAQLQARFQEITHKREEELKKKEELKAEEEVIERQVSTLRNRMQEIVQKRNNAMGLLEEKRRDIGTISSIPAGAEQYREYSQSQLKRLLNRANQHLLKFDKVNRKAMNQYLLFSERKNEFKSRHKELEEGLQSIHSLIATLDERKNEAIIRTFKQVSVHFREAFQEMIPNGSAELVIKKDTPESDEFSGIGIRVQFTNTTEVLRMNQLSGGQKAIVALAMIFAIQRADPAPFYLLDEVDAELDVQYRLMVAQLIKKQAEQQGEQCQLFCTTFKPEIVDVATQFYRITLRNESSRMEKTTKEEAIEFVQARQSIQPPEKQS